MAAQTYFIKDKRGLRTSIANVKNVTWVDDTVYDLTTYRDDPTGVLNASDLAQSGPTAVMQTYIGSASLVATGVSDVISHTAPRFEAKKRTRVCFWSGKTGTQSVTTTNLSATVTVTTKEPLAVGQTISGTGIPAGATILSIATDPTMTITMSIAATASGTVTGTFGDGDLLGFVYQDENPQISTSTFTRI